MPEEKLSLCLSRAALGPLLGLGTRNHINSHLHALGIQVCSFPGVCILYLDSNRERVFNQIYFIHSNCLFCQQERNPVKWIFS